MKKFIPFRIRRAASILLRGEAKRPQLSENWFQAAGRKIEERGLFVGCPLHDFEVTSKDMFCLTLLEGLKPTAKVLEIGGGCLRTGYHFIRYLNPGLYCAIEPNVGMLEAGRELLLGTLDQEKRPRFDHNDAFSFGAFGETFEFVVAFSIWSHASKAQIATMLDEFRRHAKPGAKFIASWIPPQPMISDYWGDEWVGRSHQSDDPGLVAHSREWLMEAVSTRNLTAREFEGFTTLNQHWLIVTHQ
jgi:hypothetical protein